ncbi:MucBP domain-containing protein [Levilactobacillus angrenensis]|uniref:MucBP domain-containing protein n=1 Tax=Levilactobacillus angrenensis TaxID=2486020 RepID=A0ABW1UCE9_9LACO|nr:MucBP domain-containing protein [Levilactobacillus angrenensis]
MRVQPRKMRCQSKDKTDKYGIVVAVTLMGVGWQLQATVPAAADQPSIGMSAQQPVTSSGKGESSSQLKTASANAAPVKPASVALTPDEIVDQAAITRTVAQATQPTRVAQVDRETEPQQGTSVTVDKETTQSADRVNSSTAVAPVPAIATDELPETPVQAYTSETIDQWMPNKILQRAVLLALQDTPQADGKTWATQQEITQQDMRRLQSLYVTGNAESHGISSYIDGKTEFSLKGLAYAVNLTTLSLGGGHIQSKPFNVYGDVVDISPLAYLPKLESAALDNNRIADISPLRYLQQLDRLYLTFNRIADFSPLMDHEFSQLTVTRQMVTLPAIEVDAQTRRAQMASPYIQPNGPWAVAGLGTMPVNYLRQNISFQLTKTGHLWNFVEYHTMPGTDIDMGETDDDWGTLYFKNIPDQLPGDHGGLEDNKTRHQIALPDYYYLMGEAYPDTDEFKTTDGDIEWYVVQPYTIVQKAGAITVHYQDQTGQTLAPDRTLPQGNVGDAYDTSQLVVAIKGYTLTTPPDNAAGKYTAEPISVTYVYRKNPVKPDTTRPPVPGVTPPAEVTPPETTLPEVTPPSTVAPPTVTEPSEVVPPETPPAVALPAPATAHPAGTSASAVTPTTAVDTAGIGDLLNRDSPLPQQPVTARQRPSSQPVLPQTNERQNVVWWGVILLVITAIGGWFKKSQWLN